MDFHLTEEQEELRAVVRTFLDREAPLTEVRRLMATPEGYDQAVWSRLAGEIGLAGLAIPEKYGGSGYGFVEMGVVAEELGRALFCGPYLSTVVLAANALLRTGDLAACDAYLPRIAAGELIATVAVAETGGVWRPAEVTTRADQVSDGWAVTGTKVAVLDGNLAHLILVAAHTDAGVSLFAVDCAASGLTRTPTPSLDETRKLSRLDFAGTPATLVGAPGAGAQTLAAIADLAAVALAAEQVGGARQCLASAVEYATVREQFGQPIGAFQAVQHRCADMLVAVETAASAAAYAMWAADRAPAELPVLACLALAHCSDAFTYVAAENIHLHGGNGFTWEFPAHLYYRRALGSALLFGTAADHRDLLADRLGL